MAAVAAIGGYIYWRWHQKQPKNTGRGSPFKFPGSKLAAVPSAGSSSLPRNKAGNNKKNKARRKQEKERRIEKREEQKGKGASKEEDQLPPQTAILNYSYLDSASKKSTGSILPKQERKNKLTASDVAKLDSDVKK